jgi:carboxypeptidase C (cathepsin A)
MGGPTSTVERLVGIPVSGIIMLGAYLQKNGYHAQDYVEPAVLHLPVIAATAWYHKRNGRPDLETFVEEAYRFSYEKYFGALFLGNRLDRAEYEQVAARLAYFTGLPAGYFHEHGLRITSDVFAGELLKEDGLAVGIYDSRYTLKNAVESGMKDPVGDDPAMGQYSPAFVGAMMGPLKQDLRITFEREYKVINFSINKIWENDLKQTPMQYLLAAMRRNPDLRVMFGQGYWDLACSSGQVRYLVSQMGMPGERILIKDYPSGHMPYLGEESAASLAGDIRGFI